MKPLTQLLLAMTVALGLAAAEAFYEVSVELVYWYHQ